MDYEKKYEVALERAREALNDGTISSNTIAYIQDIFPELKESEDEKIRKELIDFVRSRLAGFPQCEKYIAWLEKQGDTSEIVNKKKIASDILRGAAINLITWIDYNAAEGNMCLSNMECKDIEDALVSGDWDKIYAYIKKKLEKQGESSIKWNKNTEGNKPHVNHSVLMKTIHGIAEGEWKGEYWEQYRWAGIVRDSDVLSWMELSDLEKQGEQKSFDYENANIQQKDFAPKQEPKFHEGEWLAENHPNNYARFVQILEIVNVQGKNRYRISRDLHNDEDITECRFIEDNWHPFNIQDAKDGDVLYSQCCKLLWIYKNEKTCHVGSNLNYNSGSIVVNKPICIPTDVHPTTKEQRDALFAKMKEAGYEWDADKKELKKISQRMVSVEAKEAMYDKPTDEEMKELLRTEYEKGRADAIAEMQKGWSEEDECILFRIINDLKFLKDTISIDPNYAVNITDIEREIDWLKSLKERCTWKPCDEQMTTLRQVISGCSYDIEPLVEMEEQFKKLREE